MCLYPKLIQNPKYKANKKNGGNVPKWTDPRVNMVPIGCGNCIECRKQKAREWQVRLNEEIRIDKSGVMVTLTFTEHDLMQLTKDVFEELTPLSILENEVARLATRRFLERWRKKYKKSVKHWLITELGHENTERIHLHGIIFTDKPQEIEKIWQYGFVYLGEWVNEQTINYIIKYVTKIDKDHTGYKPKILSSAGIGKGFLTRIDKQINKFNGTETKEYYRTRKGLKLALPRYYRNNIYSEEEREQLWLNKLDKNERYVLGKKIDISKDEYEYEQALKFAQQKNKRLGYGDDSETWDIAHYKKQRKLLKNSVLRTPSGRQQEGAPVLGLEQNISNNETFA